MKFIGRIFPILVLVVLILTSCSSGQTGTNPATPSLEGPQAQSTGSIQQLWGFYDVTFNPEASEFEIVPLRGAEFQANVTRFLQPPIAPVNLLQVSINLGLSDIPNGFVVCDVTISHPFPGASKFRGFDVMGIVMGDGSYAGAETGDVFPTLAELRLENADGYSRWWNPTEFTTYGTIFGYTQGVMGPGGFTASGTFNGYKYFADDLDANEPMMDMDLGTRGTFGVDPGVNSRTYEIQFPIIDDMPFFKFNYAITASYYGPMNHDDPEYPVEVYPLSANLAEAFMIDIVDAGSSAYWENVTTYGGDLMLDVEVYDWGLGGTSTVSDEIAGLYAGGEVLGGFTWFPVEQLDGEPGSSIYSYIFHMDFTNLNLTGVDDQEVIFGVRSVEPDSYAPDLPGITGFVYPEDVYLTSYTIYEAEISSVGVSDEECPTEVHGDFTKYQYSNSSGSYMVTFETAWQVAGAHAGKLLIQNSASEIRAYDVTDTSPWASDEYIDLGTPYNNDDLVYSLDTCDYSGRVVLAIMNKAEVLDPSLWRAYDVFGTLLNEFTVGPYREPVAFDTNDNGGLYILTWEDWHDDNENHEIDEGEGSTSQIEFWEYNEDAPFYTYVSEVDVSDNFEQNNLCWDIAVSYTLNRVYALKGNYGNAFAPYGELYCWDIQSDGSLLFNELIQTQNAFTDEVTGSYTLWHGSLTNGDMEIDHSNAGTEGCRIVIMARSFPYAGHLFHVYDGDLNLLGTNSYSNSYGYAISIRPADDPADRDMIVGLYQDNGDILMSPAPAGW